VSESCQLNAVDNKVNLFSLTIMGYEVNRNDVYKHIAYTVYERTLI
jgi:hypothetical protein